MGPNGTFKTGSYCISNVEQFSPICLHPCLTLKIASTIGMANEFWSLVLITAIALNSCSTVALETGRQIKTEDNQVSWEKIKLSPFLYAAMADQKTNHGLLRLTSRVVFCRSWHSPSKADTSKSSLPTVWKLVAKAPSLRMIPPPSRFLKAMMLIFFKIAGWAIPPG